MEGGRLAAVFRARRAEPRRWRDGELAVAREVAQSTWEAACRLRAEAALRASEERFRQFADFVPAFLWRADAEGAITYVNDRWCAYTGRPPGEAAPDGWLDSLHPEDAERTRAAWLAAVHGGAPTGRTAGS
jgi:PAS domain-containing protein